MWWVGEERRGEGVGCGYEVKRAGIVRMIMVIMIGGDVHVSRYRQCERLSRSHKGVLSNIPLDGVYKPISPVLRLNYSIESYRIKCHTHQ